MTRLCIQGGHVIDNATQQNGVADVWIYEDKIAAVGAAPAGFTADATISAAGCTVSAGWVDLAARCERLADLPRETAAAAKRGITTMCVPPDLSPIIDNSAVAELVQHKAAGEGHCRVVPLGALTQELKGKMLSSMAALKAAGCVGVSQARTPLLDTRVLQQALAYAATLGLTVFLYPEDPWLADGGVVHEGIMSARLGLAAIPSIAEEVAVNTILSLVKVTGAHVHFCRLSTEAAVLLIAEARQQGLPITADVAIHQLYFTEMDIESFNEMYHVRPPLRTESDRLALRAGVAGGVISAICSDHTPHNINARLAPFAATEPGIAGLETLLPLVCQLAADNVADLPTLLDCVTQHPARILGVDVGTLEIGKKADLCVFDANAQWTLTADNMLSAGRNTPLLGETLQGKVKGTVIGGKWVAG